MHEVKSRRLFIVPEWRTAYVSVPKNACTSLKWVVADLAGEDPARLGGDGLTFTPTRAGLVHRRETWQKVPLHADVESQLSSIDPEEGWFVFGVVRDPHLRLFSAWQDKYLLHGPGYWRFWDRPGAPGAPRTPEDVISAFRRFVLDQAAGGRHPDGREDEHFTSQVQALSEDVVPYSRLYDITELSQLMSDLHTHLESQGFHRSLSLGRSNKSPFQARAALFDDDVREAVQTLYPEDFDRFGDRWDPADLMALQGSWSPDAFAHAETVIATNERISDLVRTGRRLRRQNARNRSAKRVRGRRSDPGTERS